MATVVAAALALGIPALVLLGAMGQRFTLVEQRIGSLEQRMDQRFISLEKLMDQRFTTVEQRLAAVESEIQAEMKPAMTQLREGLSDVEREVAVQSERINGMNERMTNSFTHLRELIDERIPKRG